MKRLGPGRPATVQVSQQGMRESIEMLGSKSNLCIVALAYYPEYLANLRDSVKALSRATEVNALALVLNNSQLNGSTFQDICRSFYCVRHNNGGAEFGGYQAGLDIIKQNVSTPFDLIIINDSATTHYRLMSEHLKAFTRSMTNEVPNRVVGQIDRSPLPSLQIDDLETSKWVRSNLIGLDHDALLALDYQVYLPYLNDYVNDSVDSFFTAHIKATTRQHIAQWLFGKDGLAWYGAAPLTAHNCKKMAAKARSIVQELHLAMRLKKNKSRFIQPERTLPERISVKVKGILDFPF
jgi:hypothetical protein